METFQRIKHKHMRDERKLFGRLHNSASHLFDLFSTNLSSSTGGMAPYISGRGMFTSSMKTMTFFSAGAASRVRRRRSILDSTTSCARIDVVLAEKLKKTGTTRAPSSSSWKRPIIDFPTPAEEETPPRDETCPDRVSWSRTSITDQSKGLRGGERRGEQQSRIGFCM